jgi:hypothetical protein
LDKHPLGLKELRQPDLLPLPSPSYQKVIPTNKICRPSLTKLLETTRRSLLFSVAQTAGRREPDCFGETPAGAILAPHRFLASNCT